nr:MAG TPA: hypothetical protein [Caudoviricetes sp.]
MSRNRYPGRASTMIIGDARLSDPRRKQHDNPK